MKKVRFTVFLQILIFSLFVGCDNLSVNPSIAQEILDETTGTVCFINTYGNPQEQSFNLKLGKTYSTLPTPAMNPGYYFLGWNTYETSIGNLYFTPTTSIYITHGKQTFFSVVDYVYFNINYFNIEGITNISDNPDSFRICDYINFSKAEHTSKTFMGFYWSENDFIDNTKRVYGWSAGEKTEDINLYARWNTDSSILHSLTYTYNGAPPNPENWNSYEETENITLKNLSDFYYNGSLQTFSGWYTTPTFDEGTQISGWKAGEKTEDIILYARWLNQISISIPANPYGEKVILSSSYDNSTDKFVMSIKNSSGDALYKNSELTDASITLYQGGTETGYSDSTFTTTKTPSLEIPSWYPETEYTFLLEVTINGVIYSGFVTVTK